MSNTSTGNPDLSLLLPRDVYYVVIHTLHTSLPLPDTDSPDDLARRDNAAIAKVASLLPVTAAEAELAAQFVAASAQSTECLRLARLHRDDEIHGLKCNAQSARMMRESRSALGMLLRLQAMRQKRDADADAANSAAWTEHCVIGLMAEALGRTQPSAIVEPPPEPAPEPEEAAAEPRPDLATKADKYAAIYPRRAAAIRKAGGVTAECGRDPIPQELVDAIINGTSPILRQLDDVAAATA